jgi:hypothetical protein
MRISAWAISFIFTADIGFWILNSIGSYRATSVVAALTFLANLNRPCFLIDLQAVQRSCSEQQTGDSGDKFRTSFPPIPPIYLPSSNECLVAFPIGDNATNFPENAVHTFEENFNPIDILREGNGSDLSATSCDYCYGYIHCQVDKPSLSQMQEDAFLAQLNVALPWKEELFTDNRETHLTPPAHLVLGLNNHHVVSYYWARSAGAGAAMEAPGIVVQQALSGSAQLRWASEAGYTDCNSNDGKRSEWVKFLKEGDHVQLRPANIEAAIHHFREDIYGISMAGRPLGSEPIVVCKWKVVSNQ